MKADLHMHSNNSDGLYSPFEVVERAANRGVSIIALTDHDSVDGLEEAIEASKQFHIRLISGIELSTRHNNENIHILGYFKDVPPRELKEFLVEQIESRKRRTYTIIEKLKEHYNIEIAYEDIMKETKGVIARPHIARAIINRGYPYTKDEIFKKFIGDGCKAYVPSSNLTSEDGIKLLHKFGAVVVLAHPVLIKKTSARDFIAMGLDGLEAIYPANTTLDEATFISLAKEMNLIVTAGSDFHGFFDSSHHDIGTVSLSGERLEAFLKRIQ